MAAALDIRVDGRARRLAWAEVSVACALGRAGVVADKREGDDGTPAGRFALRRVHYRADRLAAPLCHLPLRVSQREDGWCDDAAHSAYNRPVRRPFAGRHERLWRRDHVYDIIVILGHNDDPPRPGLGSAIFLHLAAADFGPTEGCIALARDDLLALLAASGPGSQIEIVP